MPDGSGSSALRTGVFGGSFNPVHNGHLALAKGLLGASLVDEVWFVVSPQNPLKPNSSLLDDNLRLEMVRLAVEYEPRITASDFEFSLPRPSYMWHTLCEMSRRWPQRDFRLVIGADNWLCFDRWLAYKEILSHYGVIIYPRPGSPVDAVSLPANVRMADLPLSGVSSTLVRRLVRRGEPVEALVPPAVASFISRNGLYR